MEIIILAGGVGSRLQSVVNDVPKCMADINGKPFLYYLFQYIIPFQPKRVIMSLGYKHEIVQDWIAGLTLPFEVVCMVEKFPLGTGGAIKYALSAAQEKDVIVINGDTFFNVDLKDLLHFHQAESKGITLALKPLRDFERYGSVILKEGTSEILRFEEKKYCAQGYINGGIYIVEKNELENFPEKFSMENDYFENKVTEGSLSGYICNDYFIDIGIPEDYYKAQRELLFLC